MSQACDPQDRPPSALGPYFLQPEPVATPPAAPDYAELCATSNFSFLRGASHPEEYVTRAAELGLAAIAITDRNSLAGVVRAYAALTELKRCPSSSLARAWC
jgi:error-prone DNA polymerase